MPASSALRRARLPVNLNGSPINYANRLIGSPITSQSTARGSANSAAVWRNLLCYLPLQLRFPAAVSTAPQRGAHCRALPAVPRDFETQGCGRSSYPEQYPEQHPEQYHEQYHEQYREQYPEA